MKDANFLASQEQVVLQGTRQRIYEFVKRHPGTHLRGIERELGIAWGDFEYHIHKLETSGLVRTRRNGIHTFVFPSNIFGEKQETILALLSQDSPRRILLSIIERPGITQREIAEELGRAVPTVWWHIDHLLRLGVVGRRRVGKTLTYEVIASRDDILRFIRHYHPNVWERWGSRMHDTMLMLSPEDVSETKKRAGPSSAPQS